MKYKAVKDSGKRETFDTGSRRDTREGKGRYDLLPFYALERLATHYENGAVKYGDRNWELGQPITRYIDSCLRHLSKWMQGHDEEDHLSAAAWNILGAIHNIEEVEQGRLPETLLESLPSGTKKRWLNKNGKKTVKS